MARQLMSRKSALQVAEQALYTGIPLHPRFAGEIREIIGETTADEEARLASFRKAGEAAQKRSQESLRELAEFGERFRRAMSHSAEVVSDGD